MIDGGPIFSVLTGFAQPSANPKTGPVIQQWILRQDTHPAGEGSAIANGADYSVCGNCKLRGTNGKNRVCYVNGAALNQIYKSYFAGKYGTIDTNNSQDHDFLKRLLKNQIIRLGAYGNPSAVPMVVYEKLRSLGTLILAYEHLWDQPQFAEFRHFCMASIETPVDWPGPGPGPFARLYLAHSLGWRTFRVKLPHQPLLPGEIMCPESQDAVLNCFVCRLCTGGRGPNIAIDLHGHRSKTKYYLGGDYA